MARLLLQPSPDPIFISGRRFFFWGPRRFYLAHGTMPPGAPAFTTSVATLRVQPSASKPAKVARKARPSTHSNGGGKSSRTFGAPPQYGGQELSGSVPVIGGTRAFGAPQVLSTRESPPQISMSSRHCSRDEESRSPGPIYALPEAFDGKHAVGMGHPAPKRKSVSSLRMTPGPASYSLPPSIGGTQPLGRMRSAPSFGFGTASQRELPFKAYDGPGPKYSVPSKVDRHGVRPTTAVTWSAQPRYPAAADPSPGPAAYTKKSSIGLGNVESTLSDAPAVGFGTSSREDSDFVALALKHAGSYPSGGSYNIPGMLGRQLLAGRRSLTGPSFSKADRFQQIIVDDKRPGQSGYGAWIAPARGRHRACGLTFSPKPVPASVKDVVPPPNKYVI